MTMKHIKQFIGKLMEKDYASANKHLQSAVNQKIKQKILNNNVTIF